MDSQRWEDMKSEVLERTNVEEFAAAHLEGVQQEHDELKALCLFHDERKPSMYLNTERKVFFCQGCGEKGNVIDLYMKVRDLSFKDALLEMAEQLGVDADNPAPTSQPHKAQPPPTTNPPISPRKVKLWHQELRDKDAKVKWLIRHRGMKRKTLKKYQIGWDGQRYTIPVLDEKGQIVNVRRYDPAKGSNAKIIHYTEKRGDKTLKYGRPARLFGVDELVKARNGQRVHITEGEWDRLMLAQEGWIAVTGTHGAKTWLDSWTKLFKGKDVVLLFDNDAAGKRASSKVGKELLPVAKRVRVVNLPLDADGMKDVSDWFVAAEQDAKALEALIEQTPSLQDADGEDEVDESCLDFKVTKITTFDSVPKKYVLEIEPTARRRGEMEINGDTLGNPAKFKRAYMAYFNRLPRGMPASVRGWEDIVNVWLDRSLVVEQPPEASELAALREVLTDELRKMPVSEGLSELDRAKALETPSGERIFKAVALRRVLAADFGDVTKHTMCAGLRRIGCESKVVKVEGRSVKVWTIPRKLCQEDDSDDKQAPMFE
jgi:DNA primase